MRLPYLFLCHLLLISSVGFSQKKSDTLNVDSLELRLNSMSDSNRVKALLTASTAAKKWETKKSLLLAERSLKLSQKIPYAWGEAQAYYQIGLAYLILGKPQQSYNAAIESAQIAEKNKIPFIQGNAQFVMGRNLHNFGKNKEALDVTNQLITLSQNHGYQHLSAKAYKLKAVIYKFMGVPDSLKAAAQNSIAIYRQLAIKDTSSDAISSIGAVYSMLLQSDSAMVYYQKVKRFAIEKNDQLLFARNSLNIYSILRGKGLVYEALNSLESALEIISQVDNNALKRQAYIQLGFLNRELGNFDASLGYLKKALEFSIESGDKKFQSILLSSIGSIYFTLEQLNLALEYLNRTETINKEIDFKSGSSTCYRILSGIHRKMGNYETAWEYIRKSEEMNSLTQEKAKQFYTTLELGHLYFDLGQLDSAKSTYLKALKEYKREDQQFQIFVGLAKLNLVLNKGREASIWIEKARAINDRYEKYIEIRVDYLLTYGQLLLNQGNYLMSIVQFQKALEENKNSQVPTINRDCYAGLALAYSKIDNYDQAFYFQQLQMEINDSLSDVAKIRQALQLQTQYETKQKDQQILSMEKDQELQELTVLNQNAELTQQRQFILLLLLSLILLASLGLLFFYRYKLQQKNKNLILQTKQIELERQQEKTNTQLELAELRSEFFTNVSHEFRTPLTLILGPLEDLLEKNELENRTVLKRIHNNASQLHSLVNETLDLSKLNSGQLPLKLSFSPIGAYVTKVAQSFAPLAESQGVKLLIEDQTNQLEVHFDQSMLQKIIANLLSNAFKHTSSRDTISISISTPSLEKVVISVQDTGEGVEKEHLPLLFDRFYQVEKNKKGSGIGLALCKQLIELHNGTIEVESIKGKGSTFFVSLPLKPQESSISETVFVSDKEANESNKELASNSKTVLIIEDHAQVREYLKELLQEDFKVLVAIDGEEGIQFAEKHSPDLIVSDVMMPHKDGLELTQHLKQHLLTSHIPIVLLTAKASLNSKIAGLKAGADDYLAKPFNSQELLHRCWNLIEQRERLRQLFTSNYFVTPRKLSKNTIDQKFLEKAIGIIENIEDFPDLTVEKLCRELACNRSGVHNKLKALTGKNTTAFIKSIRLRKAADLIRNTNMNMNEVLDFVGFGSRQTFNRAFKEEFQLTPTEFREYEEVGLLKQPQSD